MNLSLECISGKSIDSEEWNSFVASSPQGGLYHDYHYINAITQNNWSGLIVRNGQGSIQCLFPFQSKNKLGFTHFGQPAFCQYWGYLFPVQSSSQAKYHKLQRKCIDLISNYIKSNFSFGSFSSSPQHSYQLPLSWNGLQSKSKFTYKLDISKDESTIFNSFENDIRRRIEKLNKEGYVVTTDIQSEEVIELFKNFKNQQASNITEHEWAGLNEAIGHFNSKQQCSIHGIRTDGKLIAAMVFFSYKGELIYLFGTTNDAYKNLGAMNSIIWDAIKKYKPQCQVFDFEGSIIKSIALFAESYNAIPISYATHQYNGLIKPLKWLKTNSFYK